MTTTLNIFIMIVSLSLSGLILLQAQGTGFGSTWGGGGETYHTKRGVEKVVLWATVLFASLFVLSIIGVHTLT